VATAGTRSSSPTLLAHRSSLIGSKPTSSASRSELIERGLAAGSGEVFAADRLALMATAICYGLAVTELSDPGSVPDELLGELLASLLGPTERSAAR
jgi:hypothetical protein